MQRWFFADDAEACDAMAAPVPTTSTVGRLRSHSPSPLNVRRWQFCVQLNEKLLANERVAVVGNCESLGNWKFDKCAIMAMKEVKPHRRYLYADEDDEDDLNQQNNANLITIWSVELLVPISLNTEYRYLVYAIDPSTDQKIVRRWETHLKPRSFTAKIVDPERRCDDIFGVHDDEERVRVDRGWLTTETIVQLKFFNAPFTWKQSLKPRQLYVKVTPMHLKIASGCDNSHISGPGTLEDSMSNDTRENHDMSTSFAFNEVATYCEGTGFHAQPQFGTPCDPDGLVLFHLTVGDFENTVYLIDFYRYSSKACRDEPPYHLGYHYVLPNLLKHSDGEIEVPITCATKHRPMGMMKFSYLIIRPCVSLEQDMHLSYSRYWSTKWSGLEVGHRGLGPSFKKNDENLVRENTIMSLQNAADHGADMVEFDVMLTKDLVPVVYHDFHIFVALMTKGVVGKTDFLELPLREFTLAQLQNLKVFNTTEGKTGESRCFKDNDHKEHQPFPTLTDVFDAVDPSVGFNIEVKVAQRLQDGKMDENYVDIVDRNLYIDCILDVVLAKAGTRGIVFSCFDPDMCAMIRFKQNRYPVMFLTLGVTERYLKFMDPRCDTIKSAVCHSLAMELLGVVANSENLLRDRSQVDLAINSGLVLFCWGDDNNSKETIKMLKNWGLHAIIYDKMDINTTKEIKTSIFQLQARESQSDSLRLQALEQGNIYLDLNRHVQHT